MPSDVLILYQNAVGLDFIHSRNLVHRDVKPYNIFISTTQPVHMKLSDYGFPNRGEVYQLAHFFIFALKVLLFVVLSRTWSYKIE